MISGDVLEIRSLRMLMAIALVQGSWFRLE